MILRTSEMTDFRYFHHKTFYWLFSEKYSGIWRDKGQIGRSSRDCQGATGHRRWGSGLPRSWRTTAVRNSPSLVAMGPQSGVEKRFSGVLEGRVCCEVDGGEGFGSAGVVPATDASNHNSSMLFIFACILIT